MVHRESQKEFAVISLDDEMCLSGGIVSSDADRARAKAASERRSILPPVIYISVAVLSGLGLIGKMSLLRELLPLPARALELIIAIGLALPLLWPVAIRFRKIVSVAFLVALVGVFLGIFPRVERMHSQRRGTDQPDCIIAASQSLMTAQWPYERAKIWSQNPLSCGPGWVALQAPAVLVAGYRWNLILCWAFAVAAIIGAVGWSSASALLSLLALSPGLWLAAANGSDFLTFGIAITALYLASEKFRTVKFVNIVLLALVAQFRFPTMLVPAFLCKKIGRKGVIWASALALGCQLIFLFWNAKGFIDDGPLHLFYKLTNSSALSTNPWVVSVEVIVPLMVAILAVVVFEQRTPWRWDLLAFFGVVFVAPAVLDLVTKYHLYGSMQKAWGFWEGDLWICGCLPLAAAMLVLERKIGERKIGAEQRQTGQRLVILPESISKGAA